MQAIIFTDGSANNHDGSGGWASIIRTPTQLVELSGWATGTTSNRMELTAAIEGLRYLKVPTDVDLVADSAYLLNTLRFEWWRKWLYDEPHRTKPRPNMDLWQELIGLTQFHNVRPVKVKGHSGEYWNTRADKLAGTARTNKTNGASVLPNFDFVLDFGGKANTGEDDAIDSSAA